MRVKHILIVLLLFIVAGCKKDASTSPTYNNGEMTIFTDPAFESVTTALADGYMMSYPDTKIKVITKKEDEGLMEMLNNKAKIIVMSRDLTADEIKIYEKNVDLKFQPAKFAADAVVFIVPKFDPRNSISFNEIRDMLKSDKKDLIFSGTNSSDLNFVADVYKTKPADLKFSVIRGTENLVNDLQKFTGKVGVIGLNTFSRPYGEEAIKLREKFKVLSVEKDGVSHFPETGELGAMTYPFTRVLYFMTNEGNFSIANGFIRYSCTQLGQMIVQKEGLQRFYLYKREVRMQE